MTLQVLVLWDAAGARLTEYPAFLQPVINRVVIPFAKQLGFRAQWPSHTSKHTEHLSDGISSRTAEVGSHGDGEAESSRDISLYREEL